MRALLLALGLALATPAGAAAPAVVLVATEPAEGGLHIRSEVLAMDAVSAKAEVVLRRQSTSGQMQLSQGGEITLAKGARAVVGETQLSFGPGDRLEIHATLTVAGRVVSVSTTTIDATTP